MRWWLLVFLVLPLAFLGCQEKPAQARKPCLAVKPIPQVVISRSTSLFSGETFPKLLERLGVSRDETGLWVHAAAAATDLRRLPAGTPVTYSTRWGVAFSEVQLSFGRETLVLTRAEDGTIQGDMRRLPIHERFVAKGGPIDGSLFATVTKLGEGDELASALAEVFAWQVDFHRDLQPGDQVEVLFVRQEHNDELVGYGPVLAATLVNRGKAYKAFRFLHEGRAGYYDEFGRPLRRQFLRSPLPYSRVTSRFSLSRYHPVLKRSMPHYGVDYGAPEGTPVRVTADGVVRFVGWKGGGGKTVEVRHPGGYVTAYLHLSRFAPGIKVGGRVRQGEVVGLVGSTGLATGPHLDYRVMLHGRYLNPARIATDPLPPLAGAARDAFFAEKARLEEAWKQAAGTGAPLKLMGATVAGTSSY